MRHHQNQDHYLIRQSLRQSFLKNSKIESKKDVIIIGDSMLDGINEAGLSDDVYISSRLKITRVHQR